MKLDRIMLSKMYQSALTEYKDKAKRIDETGDEFLARCWCEAFMGVIQGEGYVVKVIANGDPVPDGVESISIVSYRMQK